MLFHPFGDPVIGEGLDHLKTHAFCRHDTEAEITHPLDRNVEKIVAAWTDRLPKQAV